MQMDFSSENEQTAQYLWNISTRLSTTCPAASRYYVYNLERKLIGDPSLLKTGVKRSCLYCNHCGSLWATGNHRVRVKPPPSPCGHTRALLKSQKTNPMMSNRQKKHLKKFLEKQTSKIVYTCFICKKKTEFPGIVKPGRKVVKQNSFHTPVPKIKCKKRDLNAGLFVKTPAEDPKRISYCQDDSNSSSGFLPQLDTSVQVTESESANNSVLSKKSSTNFSTPGSASNWLPAKHSTPANLSHPLRGSPSTNSQNRKNNKRKTLSAHFLNDEQKKKKKSSLSSFLVSL